MNFKQTIIIGGAENTPPATPLQVHTATVTHRHGSDVYVARTEDGLYDRLADYALQWWGEAELPMQADGETPRIDGLSSRQIVEAYFTVMNERETEYYDLGTATLGD